MRLARIELAKRDFWEYCKFVAPDFYKEDRAFLKDLCESLQRFYESEEKILVINMPPRHGKSRTATLLVQWLFGPIEKISGTASFLDTGVEWQYILTGATESGVLFSAKNSTRAVLDNTAKIYGTDGWVEIPEYWKARKAIFHLAGKDPEVLEFPCQHELVYEVEHIVSCLAAGRTTSPVVTEEVSCGGIRALEQVKKAWGQI